MAITNGYATLAEIKVAVGISDTTDDTVLEAAVETASRQIDAYCGKGRKFWQDSTVVARKYRPAMANVAVVDDVSTLTGLLVKVDTSDNGTFDTSLTIATDFQVEPLNAAAESPVRPWTLIRLLDGTLTQFTALGSGRPAVEVTAKFGWSAVPTAIARACIIQARSIYKAPDTQFGSFQLSIDGQPQRVPALDPMARAQLEPYIRFDEVDD
jgi:hypothetical protein|tara:strand:+ start:2140 stop:2772 length:633 start_codon:yes stop_codon:yes gene_type:complete